MSKKKHEWTRKGVTASMAVVLVFGMVPAVPGVAFADASGVQAISNESENDEVSQFDGTEYLVGDEKTLFEALGKAQDGDVIKLTADFEITKKVTITERLKLDGGGHVIKAANAFTIEESNKNGTKHLLGVEGEGAAGSTIVNLTLDSNQIAYGFQPYNVKGVVYLGDVTLKNSFGTGMTVNGSSVEASKLTVEGSGWQQSIDVSNGVGVEGTPALTLFESNLNDPIKIFEDVSSVDAPGNGAIVTVDGERWYPFVESYGSGESLTYKLVYAKEQIVQISSEQDLVEAIKGQRDGQTWEFEIAGTYDVFNSAYYSEDKTNLSDTNQKIGGYVPDEILDADHAGAEYVLPIYVDDLTIKKAEGVTGAVVLTSSAEPDARVGGMWNYQNFITVFGSNVTIDGIDLKPNRNLYYGTCNKVLELYGDGASDLTIKDVSVIPVENNEGTSFGGSIYFNTPYVGNSVIQNLQMDAWINAKAVTSGSLTIDGLVQDYSNSEYAGYSSEEYGYAWNPVVSASDESLVSVSDYTIIADSKTNLSEQIFNSGLRAGTTIKLKPGSYDVTTKGTVSGTEFYGSGMVIDENDVSVVAYDPESEPVLYGFSNGANAGVGDDGRLNGQDTIYVSGDNVSLQNLKIMPLGGVTIDNRANDNEYQKTVEVTKEASKFEMTGCETLPNVNKYLAEDAEGQETSMATSAGLIHISTDDAVLRSNKFGTGTKVCAGWKSSEGNEVTKYYEIDARYNYWGNNPDFGNLVEGDVKFDPYYVRDTMRDPYDLNTYNPSAGGGSTAPSEPEGEVTENEDGSTTTTVTEEDGSSVETTVSEDEGVTTVVEKDEHGAVVSITATVTQEAVEAAGGGAVVLPFAEPVEAKASGEAVAIEVEAPAKARIAVPVAKAEGEAAVAPGAVLALVDAEGGVTVLPKTANTGEALSAEVPGDCTLKVVDASADFPDVADDAWYAKQGVDDFISARGVMTGVEVAPGSFEFQGDEPTNRGMFVTMLHRLESEPAVDSEGFADVPEGSWYAGSSEWAVEAGIATGYLDAEGNATFDGDGKVTREQMATFLFRYANWLGLDTSARADREIEGVSEFAEDAMSWAVAEGLIQGDDDTGAIRPGDGATRAEAAVVVMRMIDLMA